ncbi:MAG: trans-aconitate 2-methyltransferase [Acidimicrobiaceae bacterium]|jgi:trans-aconitate methyltransferase
MAGRSSHDVGLQPWLPAWDGALYAANTDHHRRYDARFLATLPLKPTDRVLDLGCGAGDLTATVATRAPDGHVVGVDPQPSLLAQARSRAGANQSFVEAAAQHLSAALPDDASFDVVFSQSMLHWVPWTDHPSILRDCRRLLRSGGALRVECGGGDNVREVVAFLDEIARDVAGPNAPRAPWTFVHAGAYLDLLLEIGFDVRDGFVHTVAQRRSFDRDSILGWLSSQAVEAYAVDLAPEQREPFRASVAARVDELRRPDGTYDLTFVRLDLLAFIP